MEDRMKFVIHNNVRSTRNARTIESRKYGPTSLLSLICCSYPGIGNISGELSSYHFFQTASDARISLDKVLNVDQALWLHALNYTLINFDSYVGYA